jgi:hypothetical protein
MFGEVYEQRFYLQKRGADLRVGVTAGYLLGMYFYKEGQEG